MQSPPTITLAGGCSRVGIREGPSQLEGLLRPIFCERALASPLLLDLMSLTRLPASVDQWSQSVGLLAYLLSPPPAASFFSISWMVSCKASVCRQRGATVMSTAELEQETFTYDQRDNNL